MIPRVLQVILAKIQPKERRMGPLTSNQKHWTQTYTPAGSPGGLKPLTHSIWCH